MKMVIIVPVIIIIIISMTIPNTQSRPKDAGGNHRKKTRTHIMPHGGRGRTTTRRPTPGPHHTTGRGEASHHHTTPHHTTPHHTTPHHREGIGGGGGGGGSAEPGSFTQVCVYTHTYICMYVSMYVSRSAYYIFLYNIVDIFDCLFNPKYLVP